MKKMHSLLETLARALVKVGESVSGANYIVGR